MQFDFDYDSVPVTFIHCTYGKCLKADECLRQKIIACIPPRRESISIKNPTRIPENGIKCPYFFPDRKSRFDLGITHLLDNIPYNKAKEIKNLLFNHFQRNTYYRILNKERLINPAEQMFYPETLPGK